MEKYALLQYVVGGVAIAGVTFSTFQMYKPIRGSKRDSERSETSSDLEKSVESTEAGE